MKNKLLSAILAIALAASATSLVACGSKAQNTAPVITGVKESFTVEAGTVFDALEGVTATDKEDGNLTDKIVVTSMPSLDFTDGKATPEQAGTYELTYSVTDSGKLTTEEYGTLTVTRKQGTTEQLTAFDFTNAVAGDFKSWFGGYADPAKGTAGLEEGAIVFRVTDPGTDSGQVMLKKLLDVKPASYKLKVFLKSSVPTLMHIGARKASLSVFENYNQVLNLEVDTTVKAYELCFDVTEEGQCELGLYLGKIVSDEQKATPDNYVITIVKAEIYETIGTETEEIKYYQDFAASADSVSLACFAGAQAAVTNADGAAKIGISAYPEDKQGWNLKAAVAIGNETVESGETYYFRIKVTAKNAQSGELCLESNETEWQNRAYFSAFTVAAGETKEFTGRVVGNNDISDAVLRFYLGAPSEGVTENEISIEEVTFGTIKGDKTTQTTVDRFSGFGKGTDNFTNPATIWDTFNGTDEGFDKGIGTIWTADGKLNYRIYEAGNVDWYNKLYFGYPENPLVLPANCYFTVKFKVSATKNISCAMMLNTLGEWNPRLTEVVDITTEEKEFVFNVSQEFVVNMNMELLFQFGSAASAELGEVTVTFSDMVILKTEIA